MPDNLKINYVEFAAHDLNATKAFFSSIFDWQFEDFGDDYTAFTDQGIDGGFYRTDDRVVCQQSAPLIIFYSDNLTDTLAKVEAAGGLISRQIFNFPGGRRFHFIEPSGNELAVWSDDAL